MMKSPLRDSGIDCEQLVGVGHITKETTLEPQ